MIPLIFITTVHNCKKKKNFNSNNGSRSQVAPTVEVFTLVKFLHLIMRADGIGRKQCNAPGLHYSVRSLPFIWKIWVHTF